MIDGLLSIAGLLVFIVLALLAIEGVGRLFDKFVRKHRFRMRRDRRILDAIGQQPLPMIPRRQAE